MYALRKEWNTRKGDCAPWWEQNSKEVYASGLLALSQGLKNWKESGKGKRAGPSMGFPRFKRHGQKVGVRFRRYPGRECATGRAGTIPGHKPAGIHPVLGVDVGVKADALLVAACPTGEEVLRVPAPGVLVNSQARLRALGRKAAKRPGQIRPSW